MVQPKKIWYLLLFLILLAIAIAAKLFFFDTRLSHLSTLRIDSFPKASVFINDKEMGQTPFVEEKIVPGDYNLRLVPRTQSGEVISSWQTKIKLTPGTLTYVSRDIATVEEKSSGQILMLESLPSDRSAEVTVVSDPDSASVMVDGLASGKTPIVLRDVTAGDHEVVVSSDGFTDEIVRGKVISGYRLNIIVKLSTLSFSTGSGQLRPSSDLIASLSGKQIDKPYIVVNDTPTGFLRVRIEPSASATEVARINPREKFPLLSEIAGWVKIKLPSIFGWVSDQYVEKVK